MATQILASNQGRINIPTGPFLDARGNISPAWQLWLLNPNVQSLQAAAPLEPYSGGLGVSTTPAIGQLPVATSTGVYVPSSFTSLPLFTSTAPGLTPASGGGTFNYLRADGSWINPVAGSTGQIQYNSGSLLSASALFTYTVGTSTLTLSNIRSSKLGSSWDLVIATGSPGVTDTPGNLTISVATPTKANTAGGKLTLSPGAGTGTGAGGDLIVTTANNPTADSGGVNITTGTTGSTKTAGSVSIITGDAGTTTGAIASIGGADGATNTGASLSFAAGTGVTGGVVTFNAGAGSTTDGNIEFLDGYGTSYLKLFNAVVGGSASLAFFGSAGATQAAAYTKTYSTASRTVPNATFTNLVTTAATNGVPWGFATQAQADAIATKVNALAADNLILKQLIVSLINDSSASLGVGLNAT